MRMRMSFMGALLIGSVLVTPALAQTVDFKKALPEGTIAYVGMPDIETSLQEMQDGALARMWRESEVQDFFADLLALAEAEWDRGLAQFRDMHEQGMMPVDPDDLLKLRVRGASFALTSLDLTAENGEPMPKVGVLVHLDFGDTAQQWQQLLGFAMGMLEQQSEGMLVRETAKVGDTDIVSLVPPMTEMALNWAFVGNGVIIGTLFDEVKSAVEGLHSGGSSLVGSTNFTSVYKNLDTQGAELETYFQPGLLVDFGMKFLQLASEEAPDFPAELDVQGVDRAITALGLRSIKSLGGTWSYDGNKSRAKGYVYSPVPERQGLFAGGIKEVDLGFLKWVPRDAASFSATNFDLAGVYDAIVGAVRAYDEGIGEMAVGMISSYEDQFGVSIKEDLIGSLGTKMVSWSMPMAALGTTPETALVLEVRDEQRFMKTLRTISEISEGAFDIDESERRGIKVYQIQANIDVGAEMGFNPLEMFVPTFAFKNGYLVGGFAAGDIKRVFARMDREDDPADDIRTNEEFAPYLASIPRSGLTSVSFTDWKANFEGLYQMATSLVAFLPVDGEIPIDLSLLPDVGTLTKHLFGAVSWSGSDGNGWSSQTISPWGPEMVGVLAGVGVAGAAAVFMVMEGDSSGF